MKKILLISSCVLFAFAQEITASEDVKTLQLEKENQELKEKIKELEHNKQDAFLDDFFIDFNKVASLHNTKSIKELEEVLSDKKTMFATNQNLSSYYQSGDIVSTARQILKVQNNKTKQNEIKLQTYNQATKKELFLGDIVKDVDVLKKFLDNKIKNAQNINIDKFYLNSYGLVFCTNDERAIVQIAYDDIDEYLKTDFLEALSN